MHKQEAVATWLLRQAMLAAALPNEDAEGLLLQSEHEAGD
jgi:hypothetical protein